MTIRFLVCDEREIWVHCLVTVSFEDDVVRGRAIMFDIENSKSVLIDGRVTDYTLNLTGISKG